MGSKWSTLNSLEFHDDWDTYMWTLTFSGLRMKVVQWIRAWPKVIICPTLSSHLTCRTLRDVQEVRTDVLQFSQKLQGPSCPVTVVLVTVVLLKKQRKSLGSGEAVYCLPCDPQCYVLTSDSLKHWIESWSNYLAQCSSNSTCMFRLSQALTVGSIPWEKVHLLAPLVSSMVS